MNWLAITLLVLGLAALLHGLIRRLQPTSNTVALFCVVAGIAGIGLLLRLSSQYGIVSDPVIAGAALYAFLCELYLFALTFVIGSVSVSLLLRQLDPTLKAQQPEAPNPGDYAVMTNQRLDRMAQAGFIVYQAGTYSLTPKGRIVLRLFQWCHEFFGHHISANSVRTAGDQSP